MFIIDNLLSKANTKITQGDHNMPAFFGEFLTTTDTLVRIAIRIAGFFKRHRRKHTVGSQIEQSSVDEVLRDCEQVQQETGNLRQKLAAWAQEPYNSEPDSRDSPTRPITLNQLIPSCNSQL